MRNKQKAIFLDVETGGLDPLIHPLLSIGMIIDGKEYYTSVNPGEELLNTGVVAAKINGLSLEEVLSGRSYEAAALWVKDIFEKHKVDKSFFFVGININFDISFLKKIGIKNLPYRNIDLSSLGLFHLGTAGSDVMSELLGVPLEEKPHNALNGAIQNIKMLDAFEKKLNIKPIEDNK